MVRKHCYLVVSAVLLFGSCSNPQIITPASNENNEDNNGNVSTSCSTNDDCEAGFFCNENTCSKVCNS